MLVLTSCFFFFLAEVSSDVNFFCFTQIFELDTVGEVILDKLSCSEGPFPAMFWITGVKWGQVTTTQTLQRKKQKKQKKTQERSENNRTTVRTWTGSCFTSGWRPSLRTEPLRQRPQSRCRPTFPFWSQDGQTSRPAFKSPTGPAAEACLCRRE